MPNTYTHAEKRLNAEIRKSDAKPYYFLRECSKHDYNNTVYIQNPCTLIYKIGNHEISMKITDSYPFFSPRDVQLNSKNYLNLLQLFQRVTEKQSKNRFVPTNIENLQYNNNWYEPCICCHSILCDWTPNKNIEMVLCEIISNYNQKMKPVWLIFVAVIKRNYNLGCITIERFV
tara:strand:+ start:46 stop:567 length:522 start_codon:yes stop_codon:yes gene_type:complete